MSETFLDETITISKPTIDSLKDYCVLGVLKTEHGLKIRDELLSWFSPVYNVYVVEQEVPGKMFEYPALLFMKYLQMETKKPCLYIHTKGAANDKDSQAYVRRMWKDEFIEHKDEYFSLIDTNVPVIACPFTGDEKITWLNGMLFNYEAAKVIEIPLPKNRYLYEQLCNRKVSKENNEKIAVVGRVYNDISIGKYGHDNNPLKKKAAKYVGKFRSYSFNNNL